MPTYSYTNYDYIKMEKVSVIASFDTEGHIKPLYVRIGDGEYRVSSFWVKHRFINVSEYHCELIDGDVLRPVTLTFYQADGIWCIIPQ